MHYMNVISFIRYFPGLLRTRKMTSSQLAQLADHCTGIAEVMGSTPEQALAFFFLCFHYCFSGMSMTAKITLIVKICFITNYLAWNITCSSEGRVALLSVNERWGVRTFFLLKRKGGPTLFFLRKKIPNVK